MLNLILTLVTLVTISTSPDSVTIDVDCPVFRAWVEVDLSSGDIVQWGT